jgi:hypothetical protein
VTGAPPRLAVRERIAIALAVNLAATAARVADRFDRRRHVT